MDRDEMDYIGVLTLLAAGIPAASQCIPSPAGPLLGGALLILTVLAFGALLKGWRTVVHILVELEMLIFGVICGWIFAIFG